MANMFDEVDEKTGSTKTANTPAAAPSTSINIFDTIPEQEGVPSAVEGVDEELVSNVMAKAVAAGQPISREEAVGRAINLNKVIREGVPTISQGEGRSRLGTITENFVHGVTPFGLSRSAEMFVGKLGQMVGYENNPFTAENMEGRAAEFPTEATTAEVVGGLLPAGTGAIRALAPKIFAKASSIPGAGAVLRSLENMDFVGRTAGRVSAEMQANTLSRLATKEVDATARGYAETARTFGRGLRDDELSHINDLYANAQKSFSSYVDDAGAEYSRLKALRGSQQADKITATEADLLKVFEEGSKPGLVRGAKATERAAERAKVERAKFLVSQRVKDQSKSMGWGDKFQLAFANATGAAAGGGVGAIPKAVKEIEDYYALTDEQVASMGEYAAVKMLGNAVLDIGEGTGLGFGLGVATPVVFEGAGEATKQLRFYGGKLAEKTLPRITNILSRGEVSTKDMQQGLRLGQYLGDDAADISRNLEGFRNTAQYQYDNAKLYHEHLLESLLTNTTSPFYNEAQSIAKRLDNTLGKLQKGYMKETGTNKWEYTRKLDAALRDTKMKRTPVDPLLPDGENIFTFPLPEGIEALEKVFEDAETLAAKSLGVNPTSLLTDQDMIGVLPSIPGSTPSRYLPSLQGQTTPFYDDAGNLIEGGSIVSPAFSGRQPGSNISRGLTIDSTAVQKPAFVNAMSSIVEKPLRAGFNKDLAMDNALLYWSGQLLGAKGMAAKLAFDLAFNQKAIVNNYAAAQRVAGATERALTNIGIFATRSPQAAAQASRALIEGKGKSFQMDLTQEIGLSDKAASEYYYADKALLDKLTGPDGVEKTSELFSSNYAKLDATYPKLSADTSMLVPRAISFLKSKMDMMKVRYGYEPSKQQLYSYGLYSRYIHDPEAIYADIARREYVSTQALDVLQNVYPATYRQLKNKILDELILAKDAGEKLSRKQQVIVDKLLGNRTAGFTAQQIKNIQDSMNMSPPSAGGPLSSKRVELEREGTSQQ